MKKEPALIGTVVAAAAALLGVFGFGLSGEETAALVVVANLIAGWVIRAKVTPT